MTAPTATTRKVSAKARRYTIALVTEARRLHDDDGWTPTEIRGLLEASHGIDVPLNTLCRWVKPDQQRKALERAQRWNAVRSEQRGGRLGHPAVRPEFKRARVLALAAVGVTNLGISRVMQLDFGDAITDRHIAAIRRGEPYPERFHSGRGRPRKEAA